MENGMKIWKWMAQEDYSQNMKNGPKMNEAAFIGWIITRFGVLT